MKKVISYRQTQTINKVKKFFIQLPAELKVVFGQGLRGENINLNSVSPNQQSNLKKIKNIIKYVQNSESQTQTNTIYNELLTLCNNFSNQERTRQHKKRKQTVQGPPTNKRQRVVLGKETKQRLKILKVKGYTFSVVHRRAIGFGLLIDWLV